MDRLETRDWLQSRALLELDAYTLRRNLEELLAHRRAVSGRVDWDDAGPDWEGEQEAQRLFANFLAACSAVADHSMVHRRRFSDALADAYRGELERTLTSTVEFELVVELRTQSQHVLLPFAKEKEFHVQPDAKTLVGIDWFLGKYWLLSLKDWPSSVREYLDRASRKHVPGRPGFVVEVAEAQYGPRNDVSITELATMYATRAIRFTGWFLGADADLHTDD